MVAVELQEPLNKPGSDGGIADYSGSLVLELPIAEAAFVALQRDASRKIRIVTSTNNRSREAAFEMSLDNFERDDVPIEYNEARELFQADPKRHWAAYVRLSGFDARARRAIHRRRANSARFKRSRIS